MPIPILTKRALTVRRSRAGLGLFTEEPIKRSSYIIEYVGTVVRGKAVDELSNKYLFETNRWRMIDGSTRSNLARYANHACTPNCEVDIIAGRVFLKALRRIEAGEELTYDYGEEYFDMYIKPHGCRCGTCVPEKKK